MHGFSATRRTRTASCANGNAGCAGVLISATPSSHRLRSLLWLGNTVRHERATEFIDVVKEPVGPLGAGFVHGRASSGRFFDKSKINELDHHGTTVRPEFRREGVV
jgi:hypothetical protein